MFTSSSAGFAQLDIADPSPTRDLDVVFQPSATRPVLGIYSVDVVCSLTGGVGAAGEIQLLSDASNPPTTVRCSVFLQTGGGIGEDETVTNVVEGVLVHLVPEGHFVLLSSIPVAGGPTFGSDFATEIRL